LPHPDLPNGIVLTTIKADWFEIAKKAAELVVNLIEEIPIPHETVMPGKLIMGSTT
jgi:DNA-binding LacI/PurR family transcriptional regulator